jgi:hypothetical protein
MAVYWGDLPTSFPVNTGDLWKLYDRLLDNAGVTDYPQSVGQCPTGNIEGQHYNMNSRYQQPQVSWIWHSYPYQAIAANTWVEVSHQADPFGDETSGAWFMYAPGSGVYFNTGNTIVFEDHWAAYRAFGANDNAGMSWNAASQGYDSLQFTAWVDHVNYPCDDSQSNSGLKYMNLEIVAAKLAGTHACGSGDSWPSQAFRSGWQASKECYCDSRQQYLNCNGDPDSPGPNPAPLPSCSVPLSSRQDCGFYGITPSTCESKGCCWQVPPSGMSAPYCFHSSSQNPVARSQNTVIV